jgi:hypothetical protein
LSTVAAITRGFASDNDYKADVDGNETPKFWEPELGTFVTLACQMLSKWERNVALITSMGSDYNGLVLRRLLQERNIGLLYCRPGSHTGRQIVMTPQNCTDIRYIIDLHIQRGELSAFEKAKLEDLMPKILQSKWIAFDKYELAVIECIFESSQWNMAKRRPLVLFESGSRPLGDTQATSERGLVELKFLDNIDLFTTTWEWISTWAKKDGKSRGKHPDEWVKEIGEERKFHKLLENMLLKLMPPSEIKPQAVVVTLSSQGCYVAFRKTGEFGQYEIKHLVVPNLATNVQSRVGAGDIFRAALIQALLESKVEDLVSNKEQLLQIVNLAQYVAYRWIDRTLSKDYWGNLPINFEDLKNGFSDSVTS